MDTTKDPRLAQIESIFKVVQDSVTKDEFMRAFDVLRKVVSDMQAKNVIDFQEMNNSLRGLAAKLSQDSVDDVNEMKNECYSMWEAQKKTTMQRLDAMEARVADVKDGDTPTNQQLEALITPIVERISVVDEVSIANIAEAKIEAKLPAFGRAFRDALELLPDGEKLSPDAIEGLQTALESAVKKEGGRIGWGAHPLTVQQSGSTKAKVVRTINFTGATVTLSPSGVVTVAITPGSSFAKEIPSGTVNGANKTFTALNTPKYIVVDGVTYFESDGYSLSGLVITTVVPPTGFIYSIY